MYHRPKPKKGHLTFYLIFLCGVILLMLLLKNCSRPTWHVEDRRAGGDTLNVAIEISPVGLSLQHDTLSGFHYDMIKRLSAIHHRPLKIDGFTHMESALQSLEEGRFDIVIGDIPSNSTLRDRFLVTSPVTVDNQVLVQMKDSCGNLRYHDLFSLLGDTIHVSAKTPFRNRISHLIRELGDTIYIVENETLGSEQMIIKTALGQLPNVVVNRHLAEEMSGHYPMLDYSLNISFNQFQSWIVNKKDSALRDTLNTWIRAELLKD